MVLVIGALSPGLFHSTGIVTYFSISEDGCDGGLDDRAQVLTGGKLVVVVFAMEVAI